MHVAYKLRKSKHGKNTWLTDMGFPAASHPSIHPPNHFSKIQSIIEQDGFGLKNMTMKMVMIPTRDVSSQMTSKRARECEDDCLENQKFGRRRYVPYNIEQAVNCPGNGKFVCHQNLSAAVEHFHSYPSVVDFSGKHIHLKVSNTGTKAPLPSHLQFRSGFIYP